MDELDEIVSWARGHGKIPLPLSGWDHASFWGWDDTTRSLFAHLWCNTDDPAKPPTALIGPDDYTPIITCPVTLAQYIAIAADCDPWKVATALFKVFDREKDWDGEEKATTASEASTVVTMSEGYDVRQWPYRP